MKDKKYTIYSTPNSIFQVNPFQHILIWLFLCCPLFRVKSLPVLPLFYLSLVIGITSQLSPISCCNATMLRVLSQGFKVKPNMYDYWWQTHYMSLLFPDIHYLSKAFGKGYDMLSVTWLSPYHWDY